MSDIDTRGKHFPHLENSIPENCSLLADSIHHQLRKVLFGVNTYVELSFEQFRKQHLNGRPTLKFTRHLQSTDHICGFPHVWFTAYACSPHAHALKKPFVRHYCSRKKSISSNNFVKLMQYLIICLPFGLNTPQYNIAKI